MPVIICKDIMIDKIGEIVNVYQGIFHHQRNKSLKDRYYETSFQYLAVHFFCDGSHIEHERYLQERWNIRNGDKNNWEKLKNNSNSCDAKKTLENK